LDNVTKKKEIKAIILLFTVAMVWGIGFVFNDIVLKAGAAPSFINFVRFGGAAIVYYLVFRKHIKFNNKKAIINGIIAGVFMFGAFTLLVEGQGMDVPPSNAAFLQSMYTIIIPFMSWIFIKRKPSKFIVLSLILYAVGLSLIYIDFENFSFAFGIGEFLLLACAFCYAFQFIFASKALEEAENHTVTSIQLITAGVLCTLYFLISGGVGTVSNIQFDPMVIVALLTLTLMNTLYAYWIQTYTQTMLIDYKVSLILATENVWAAVFEVLFIVGTVIATKQILGYVAIMLAIFAAEVLPSMLKSLMKPKNIIKNETDSSADR